MMIVLIYKGLEDENEPHQLILSSSPCRAVCELRIQRIQSLTHQLLNANITWKLTLNIMFGQSFKVARPESKRPYWTGKIVACSFTFEHSKFLARNALLSMLVTFEYLKIIIKSNVSIHYTNTSIIICLLVSDLQNYKKYQILERMYVQFRVLINDKYNSALMHGFACDDNEVID